MRLLGRVYTCFFGKLALGDFPAVALLCVCCSVKAEAFWEKQYLQGAGLKGVIAHPAGTRPRVRSGSAAVEAFSVV